MAKAGLGGALNVCAIRRFLMGKKARGGPRAATGFFNPARRGIALDDDYH